MSRLSQFVVSLAWFFSVVEAADAQDAALVPADLKFTREISTRFHVMAWVTLELRDGTTEKFQYDRYPASGVKPGVERVKRSEGVFARSSGGEWKRSDDWGASGSAVDDKMTPVLDTDVNIVGTPFRPPITRDSAQGGLVWRFVSAKPFRDAKCYIFEAGREHPKPNIRYPQYTFLKASGDTDGRLFLCGVAANLRDDAGLIPFTMRMTYLIPVAAGAKIKVYDKDTGKEVLNTVTGADSGWEIETQTSEPPVAR